MKIAHVTNFFWPKKYGSNELFICRELVKQGHDVTVLTAKEPPKEYEMLAEDVPSREFFNGFWIERFPVVFSFGNILFMPSLMTFLLRNKFDLIHSHEFFTPCSFYSAIASKVMKTPLIITQHNDQLPVSLLKKFLYYYNSLTAGRFVLAQAKTIIALSETVKKHLLLFGVEKGKIEVVPNGIDVERFTPPRSNYIEEKWGISHPVVLFVGRFVEEKGIRYLLEAFKSVVKQVPDAKLVLVGTGPQQTEIIKFQNQCINHIFFKKEVKHTDMPDVYAGCDVFVRPSLHEIFGNVVLEAMASGKPVIGTKVGGLKETIVDGETGFLIQPRNSKQLSFYILKILSDEDLRKNLGKNSRKRIEENYSNNVLMVRILKIYLDAIAHNTEIRKRIHK